MAFLASLIADKRHSNVGRSVDLVSWWICGVYPIRRLKGVFFVVADGHEFLVYWASGSHACQLFCCVPQKMVRYCSKV